MSKRVQDESMYLNFKELEDEINEICDKSELKEMLGQQLNEVEMLQSMFPKPGEFCIDDYSVLVDITDFVQDKTSIIPPQLDFAINLIVDKFKFQVHVNLPPEYPACEPDIFIRSENLNRIQQNILNKNLAEHINKLDRGEICIGIAISWLQENATNYISQPIDQPKTVICNEDVKNEFTRYWIYSHHIYSKEKRREILTLADSYTLTGFCLPGRPGIICIEGFSKDCNEWWQKVKSMTWKKIVCKKIETFVSVENVDSLRKFDSFNEVTFQSHNLTSKHMDMGELYKYLEKHDCSYAFKEYFGVDGRSA